MILALCKLYHEKYNLVDYNKTVINYRVKFLLYSSHWSYQRGKIIKNVMTGKSKTWLVVIIMGWSD